MQFVPKQFASTLQLGLKLQTFVAGGTPNFEVYHQDDVYGTWFAWPLDHHHSSLTWKGGASALHVTTCVQFYSHNARSAKSSPPIAQAVCVSEFMMRTVC